MSSQPAPIETILSMLANDADLGGAAASLRATLADRDRREAALLALVETAGDLSALRDTDSVLEAIVGRARKLLESDVAYLTLLDAERGDTYMRVTSGIVSDVFKRVRLPSGGGLGGLVASTLQPQFTANYLGDPSYSHLRSIDDAVSGEGLVAILGVPIKLGAQVIGVLFAANRRVRPFADTEVALLQSLGDHAAVAIENARLFEEATRALRELTAANEVIRASNESLRRSTELHERLCALVLEGRGMADLATAAAEALDSRLAVRDAGGRLLAVAEPGADEPAGAGIDVAGVDAAVRAVGDEAARSGRSIETELDASYLVAVVRAGQEVFGHLVCWRHQPFSDVERRSLERAAQITALLLLGERSVAEAEQRVRGELLDDLLVAPLPDEATLRRRATLLGVDLDVPHVLVVAAVAPRDRHAVSADAARVAAELGGLSGTREGLIVVMAPGDDPRAIGALVHRELGVRATESVTAGAAGPATTVGDLASVFADAVRCAEVLQKLGRHGDRATAAELGVYGLLVGAAGSERLAQFVQASVGRVAGYDEARGTDLLSTLDTFLRERGNLARTSEALFIHVNTLRQRLDRLDQLLGPTWREPEESLHIQLALRVRDVLDPGAAP